MRNALPTPTADVYVALDSAFCLFNERLFEGRLPGVLITLTRKRGANGYFWGEQARKGQEIADEIALNPHTMSRSPKDVLGTLVHEMTHLEQHHYGKPGKDGYHNREWTGLMERVGLKPIAHDNDHGTGKKVTHEIIPDHEADVAIDDFLKRDEAKGMGWFMVAPVAKPKKFDLSKTPHLCEACGAKAWAKLGTTLYCGNVTEHHDREEALMLPDDDYAAAAEGAGK